jgi:hypothetical protein
MIFSVPTKFESFVKYFHVGMIDEAVVNLKADSVSANIQNSESTLMIYANMKTDCFAKADLKEVEIKNKKGDVTGTEVRKDIGFINIPLLVKSFSALSDIEGFVKCEIGDLGDSIILSDQTSEYRILLSHADIIKVPGKIKELEYPIQFKLSGNEMDALLKGMSIIEDSNFSIEQNSEKGCFVKVGVSITNNYKTPAKNMGDKEIPYLKYFNKEHVQAILSTHKSNDVTFMAMDKLLQIYVVDKDREITCSYYLSPKKDFSNE